MNNIKYLTEAITRDLLLRLIEQRGMNLPEALDTLYNSDTFEKLKDERSGLYFQSSGYVYDFLDNEIMTGKMS